MDENGITSAPFIIKDDLENGSIYKFNDTLDPLDSFTGKLNSIRLVPSQFQTTTELEMVKSTTQNSASAYVGPEPGNDMISLMNICDGIPKDNCMYPCDWSVTSEKCVLLEKKRMVKKIRSKNALQINIRRFLDAKFQSDEYDESKITELATQIYQYTGGGELQEADDILEKLFKLFQEILEERRSSKSQRWWQGMGIGGMTVTAFILFAKTVLTPIDNPICNIGTVSRENFPFLEKLGPILMSL